MAESYGIVEIEWDMDALKRAADQDEAVMQALESKTAEIADAANSLGSSFQTEESVRWATGERVGGTSPEYGHDVKVGSKGPVGIVMTKNYAAMKDAYLNNTLLKARG